LHVKRQDETDCAAAGDASSSIVRPAIDKIPFARFAATGRLLSMDTDFCLWYHASIILNSVWLNADLASRSLL